MLAVCLVYQYHFERRLQRYTVWLIDFGEAEIFELQDWEECTDLNRGEARNLCNDLVRHYDAARAEMELQAVGRFGGIG
jgi:hypothetical protein